MYRLYTEQNVFVTLLQCAHPSGLMDKALVSYARDFGIVG